MSPMLFESPLSFLVSSGLFDKTILLAEVPIHAGTEVPGWVMGFFTVVLVLMVLALAFEEKIRRSTSLVVLSAEGKIACWRDLCQNERSCKFL